MTTAAENRNTPELAGEDPVLQFVMLNDAVAYAGHMGAVDVNGEVQPAADTAGLKVVGCFTKYLDNKDDGNSITVERRIKRYDNSATYPITRSAIDSVCFVEDDTTVAGWSTNLVAGGIVVDVDADGVWVDQRPAAMALAQAARPAQRVDKTDDYTCTAAIAYEGRTYFNVIKTTALAHITFPSAVAGMRIGVQRGAAAAGKDVGVTAGAGDTIEAYDGDCAAGKSVETTVDAISGIIWWIAVDATHWKLDRGFLPLDIASWVKNDA